MTPRLKYLENKRLLCEWLGISLSQARKITANPDTYYRRRMVGKDKKREAEVPTPLLKAIHRQIKLLLDQLSPPEFLHSGRKGRSYISNAKVHVGAKSFATMDIKSFYKNTNKEHVFRFFKRRLNMAEDVAWLLADLVTYKGFLPTGSPVSQQIAFWAHSEIFERVDAEAKRNKMTFSLYVDDLSFSSIEGKIAPLLHLKTQEELKSNRLRLKRSKIRYGINNDFEITGVVLSNKGPQSPARLKKRLFDALEACGGNVDRLTEKDFRSSMGRLRSIRAIENDALPMLYHQFRERERGPNRR